MSLKVRKNLSPPPPERCPLSACMSILGGLWTANIVWYLSAGPRRFNELRIDIPKISPKILSTRLRFLQAQGVNHTDNFLLTHGDARQIGGAVRLHEMFPVRAAWASPVASRSSRSA